MTDPGHLTPGVGTFSATDTTDQITARSMELQLQGLSAASATSRAEIEASLTFERRSDMMNRAALRYIAEHYDEFDDDLRAVIARAIGPFA